MAIPVYKTIDKWVGIPLSWLLGTLSSLGAKPQLPLQPSRILIIKLWAMGDSIVMLPLIKALRERYPSATIDVLCRNRNKEVFDCLSGIDTIHLFEWPAAAHLIRHWRSYDVVIDGEPYLRLSALLAYHLGTTRIGWGGFARSKLYTHPVPFDRAVHMVHNYLSMATLLDASYHEKTLVKPVISDMDRRHVTMALESRGITHTSILIAASPGVAESSKSRQWMPERFAEVLDTLATQLGATILFIGGRSDLPSINEVRNRMTHPSITLAGQLTLAQTFDVLSRCRLAISVDTGPMHAAAAAGTPTIGLFGPNIPTLWAPFGPRNKAIYHTLDCSPCIINEKGQMPDCLRTTDRYLCMQLITTDEVITAAKKLHDQHPNHPPSQPHA